jgi:hypothetical protein
MKRVESVDRRRLLGGLLVGGLGLSGLAVTRLVDWNPAASQAAPRYEGALDTKALLVPTEYESIELALAAAAHDDEVVVSDGTYEGGIRITKSGVTLRRAEGANPIIDAAGHGSGIVIQAPGVTVDGFEIIGDTVTSSGIAINTSAGATSSISILNNAIHRILGAGGGGVMQISSWGIFAYGTEPLSRVHITGNTISDIGGRSTRATDADGLRIDFSQLLAPVGVGIQLEEVSGLTPEEGIVIRGNRLSAIRDGAVASATIPGIGIAILSLDGRIRFANAAGIDVAENEILETSIPLLLGGDKGSGSDRVSTQPA